MTSRFALTVHILGMLAWAERQKKTESLTSEELADSIRTNPVVVRRLLGALRRAGLIETRRGNGGGVALARGAEKMTLRDAYEAIEDGEELFGRHPQGPNPRCAVGPVIGGYLEDVFGAAEAVLKTNLGEVTVAAMTDAIVDRINSCRHKTAS